jgi:hypothetical protein
MLLPGYRASDGIRSGSWALRLKAVAIELQRRSSGPDRRDFSDNATKTQAIRELRNQHSG